MPLSSFMNPDWMKRRLQQAADAASSDTHSSNSLIDTETVEQHRTGYTALKEAMDQIPSEMKADLIEAWRKCPDLVQTESDPLQYLRAEEFNAWAAAFRLALYWKMRKECFEERAFLSMTETDGNGALNAQDLHLLQSAFRVVLPEDGQGCPVLLTETARIAEISESRDYSLPHRMRASFFLSTILCQNYKAQTLGVIMLLVMRERDVNRFSPLPFEILVKACPLKIKSVYSVQAIDYDTKVDFLHRVMPSAVQLTATFFGKASVPVFGDTKEEILAKLQHYGLRPESCPPSCGGTYDSHEFLQRHNLLAAATTNLTTTTTTTTTPPQQDERKIPAVSSDDDEQCRARENSLALIKLSEAMSGRMSANVGPSVNEAVEAEALLQLEDALGVIPDMDKVDYYNAKAVNPAVVHAESNPIYFLRAEKYNPWAAARRLVTYWKERKAVFGDKAFEPLTFDTLPKNSQEMIRGRGFEVLPDDEEGRPVICFNSALMYGKGRSHYTDQDRLAAVFYWIHLAAENPKCQNDSLVTFHPMFGSEQLKGSMSKGLEMMIHVFPLRWNKAHFVCIKPPESENSKNFFGPIFNILTEFVSQAQGPQLWIHVADSRLEMLTRLKMYGFGEDSLPDNIGGSLGDDYFRSYIEDRRVVDTQHLSDLQAENNRLDNRKRVSSVGEDDDNSAEESVSKKPRRDTVPSNAVLYEYEESETLVETPSMTKKGLLEMEAAIDLLPDEDKAALLEARRDVPDIVERETPSIRFLRVERYNAWAAAKRLALYWKERRSLFGENAFLPLNQTGEGALSRDDVAFINSGFFALLGVDKQGRSVILHDSSRRTSHLREPRLRALYYFWTMLSENEASQVQGYQLITVMGKPILDSVVSDAERLVAQAMPTRVEALHICNVPTVSEKKSFMETMLPVLFRLIGKLKKRSHVHVGETKEEILKKLLSYDIPAEIIPKAIGGKWGYEEFSKWQEARLRYEWDLPPASKDHDNPNVPRYHSKALADMNDEEKVERKRRMNVLHARRRRERERIEMEVFAEQVAELQDTNAALKSQNKQLEVLLASAKIEMAKMDTEAHANGRMVTENGLARVDLALPDFGRSNSDTWGMQLLLNKHAQSNGQHISLQNFLAAPSNSNFETATGIAEPSSFSLSLEKRQQLVNSLALQQAQERHLMALGQQQQQPLGVRHQPQAYASSPFAPSALDYQQQHQQQQQRQQQNFLSNLVSGSWFNNQGPQHQR